MYLTPERFRTMGLGVDLTDVEDMALRSTLERASAKVDSHCAVPLLPQKFDFRGGTMTDEQHEWNVDPYAQTAQPYRFWPWAKPVKAVSQLRIYSTPTAYIEIDPTELFINHSGGYIEISSLKLSQYSIAGSVGLLLGMYHPVAQATYTYGWQFSASDEFLEPTDGQLYRAQHQWWLSTPTPVVKINDVVQTTGYTIDYTEGAVLFTNLLTATDVVTATYSYPLPWQIQHATGIIAAEEIGQADLRARGMSGVDHLTVGEITIRRAATPGMRGTNAVLMETMPIQAQSLLADFQFRSVR